MGATNEKEKTQSIAYQRDFLGACWNSPYGVQEAQTFIPSRWCGISQVFMEYNTGHKCISLQAHRAQEVAKMGESLDVMDTATAATLVVGGDEFFDINDTLNPGSPLRSAAMSAFPASPTVARDDGFGGDAPKKKLGLPKKIATSEDHLGSTIDLMLLQQRATSTVLGAAGGAGGAAGAGVGGVGAGASHSGAVPPLGVVKPATIHALHPAPAPGASFSSNAGDARNGSFSAASRGSDTTESMAHTIRRVVRDTQAVESALHNRHLYLRAHGLSVEQDVVFRAAPAHRRYDCLGLVTTGAPEEMATRTSLRFALPERRASGSSPARLSPMHTPGGAGRPRSRGPTPDQSISGHVQPLGDTSQKDNNETSDNGVFSGGDEDALARSMPVGRRTDSPRARRSPGRAPSVLARAGANSRANKVGYADFTTNPLHARYNYHLTDTEAAIPAARLAAAQGQHRHARPKSQDRTKQRSKTRAHGKESGTADVNSAEARRAEAALRDYAENTAPLIIGSISAVELQTLPHNAEVCLGGWLYVSLEDEQKRLRRVLDNYENFLKDKQAAAAAAAAASAAEFTGSASGAPSAGRSPMRRSRRPSRVPSPALSPRYTFLSRMHPGLGDPAATGVDMLPPSALTVSKTTGTFEPTLRAGAAPTAAAATTDSIGSEKSTPTPLLRRARSIDGAVRSVPSSPLAVRMPNPAAPAFRLPSMLGNRRFLNSQRAPEDPLAPEDFWVPHAYMIIALPMYECSVSPTVFHTMNNRTRPVSVNIINPLSRESFGVGCITGIRYGGVIVLECREPVTAADKEWLLALKKLGEQCQAMAAASAAKAAAAAAVPRDLSVSAAAAAARRAAEEAAIAEATAALEAAGSAGGDTDPFSTPSMAPDPLERSVLRPYDAPLRDADLAWLQRKRVDKIRFLRRALRSKLQADGFSVIFAYTRTARRQRRAATRRTEREIARMNDKDDDNNNNNNNNNEDGGTHNDNATGGRTPVHTLSREPSLPPMADTRDDGDDANEDDDENDEAAEADAQDDQDDVSSEEELELDWDGITNSHEDGEDDLGDPLDVARHDDDPFMRRQRAWLASAAQDATTPANYTIKGTFRQIGGVRYFDTAALLEGCAVRDVVEAVLRWARNLRRIPVKARPLSLFLQRYEGIAPALRLAQGSATRAVMQTLYRTGAPANVLLQANTSFSRTTSALPPGGLTGPVPGDSFSPGTTGSFNLATTGAAGSPASPGPLRPVFPFVTYYTGPLDPIVRAILSPEVEHMIRAAEEGVAAAAAAKIAAEAASSHTFVVPAASAVVAARFKNKKRVEAIMAQADPHAAATPLPPPASRPTVLTSPTTAGPHGRLAIADHPGVEMRGAGLMTAPTAPTTTTTVPTISPTTKPPRTIETMLAGATPAMPLNNASIISALSPSGAMANASFTNASFTNTSFTNASFAGMRVHNPSTMNGTFSGPLGSPALSGGALPNTAADASMEAGFSPSHVLGAPVVSNNTFIAQSGVCVQRPPERYAPAITAATTTADDRDDSRSSGVDSDELSLSDKTAATREGSKTARHVAHRHREEDVDAEDGPPALNQTLRLSQIALDAVKADDRASRSQEWLDADADLRQVKAELEEMRFLVANADAELEQRIQEYVTTSSLFLPHTRVDQTSLMLLSVKMLRQFPDDVPVKELHSDWLPLLLATLTLPSDHVFVTERTLTVRDHQARQQEGGLGTSTGTAFVMHSQDSVYGHLMPPEDVCDANKRREAFNEAGASCKYAIEAIRPLPPPQPLHDVVIAPIPYRITAKTALALEQQGLDTSYSFCFTGGSLGVLAGVLRVYSDTMRARCQSEIERVLATGGPAALRAEANNSIELLLKSGHNVFLRRIWIWGSTSKKTPGFFHRLFGMEELDDDWSEVGAGDEDTPQKKKKKKKRKSVEDLDRPDGSMTGLGNESTTSTAERDRHGNMKRAALPYRVPEAYALFDAIMHYLHTYRDMEKDFRVATSSDAAGGGGGGAGSTAYAASPTRKRRSFLQPRRATTAASAMPLIDEPVTEELLVSDFELCVATNYYYKRSIVEEAYRCTSVFGADTKTRPAQSPPPPPGTSAPQDGHSGKHAASAHKHGTAHTARRKPGTTTAAAAAAASAASAAARRLLSAGEEQRRAKQLAALVLYHSDRRTDDGEPERSRKCAAPSKHSVDRSVSECEPFRSGDKSNATAHSDSKPKKSTRKWQKMAVEVELPYCGGEEAEKHDVQDNAKGLYDFLETSLGRWRDARQSDLNVGSGGGGNVSVPRNEVQDSCATPYERVEMEKMVRNAVKLSLS